MVLRRLIVWLLLIVTTVTMLMYVSTFPVAGDSMGEQNGEGAFDNSNAPSGPPLRASDPATELRRTA